MSGHWSTSTSAGAAIVFLGDQSPVPTQDRIRGDDARDLRQDPPSELLAAHGESTALGIGQAKRPRAQVLPENPILLPEIRDQIVLVAGHPASEREDEELQRRRHSLRLLGGLDQHRPRLGRFFAPYAISEAKKFATENRFDCIRLRKRIDGWEARTTDFDWVSPKEGSRLTVNIQLGPGIAGKLQASSDNCAKLVEMLKTYIVPNLAR